MMERISQRYSTEEIADAFAEVDGPGRGNFPLRLSEEEILATKKLRKPRTPIHPYIQQLGPWFDEPRRPKCFEITGNDNRRRD